MESVALTVNENVPGVVGTPLSVPLLESVRRGGSVPVLDQV
jgi:hypothetical protein